MKNKEIKSFTKIVTLTLLFIFLYYHEIKNNETIIMFASSIITLFISYTLMKREQKRDDNKIKKITIEISTILKYNFLTILNEDSDTIKELLIIPEDWKGKISELISIIDISSINELYKIMLIFINTPKNNTKNDLLKIFFHEHLFEYSPLLKTENEKLELLNQNINNILESLELNYNKNIKRRYINEKKEEATFYINYYEEKTKLRKYKFFYENYNFDIEINNGKYTGFKNSYINGELIYSGNLKNDKKHGLGKEYNNETLVFDGIYEDDKMKNGKLKNNFYKLFEGEFKNGMPYNGRIEWAFDYHEGDIIEYNGELKNGELYNGDAIKIDTIELNRDLNPFEYCHENRDLHYELDKLREQYFESEKLEKQSEEQIERESDPNYMNEIANPFILSGYNIKIENGIIKGDLNKVAPVYRSF